MTAKAAEIVALAERVEQATGADRELDAAVWLHLPEQEGHAWKHGGDRYKHAHQIAGCSFVPAYTASLDAAISLIGDDQYWRLGNDGEGPDVAAFKATVTSGEGPTLRFHNAIAATPALALTAAALRARASQITDQPQLHGEG